MAKEGLEPQEKDTNSLEEVDPKYSTLSCFVHCVTHI